MIYYNTVKETGKTLKENIDKTKTQDQKVKQVIQSALSEKFTTYEVWENYNDIFRNKAPYSSIVRSVNTLKNEGFIEETGNKVKGQYGRNVLELKKSSNTLLKAELKFINLFMIYSFLFKKNVI